MQELPKESIPLDILLLSLRVLNVLITPNQTWIPRLQESITGTLGQP
jgi:hypothetical protein